VDRDAESAGHSCIYGATSCVNYSRAMLYKTLFSCGYGFVIIFHIFMKHTKNGECDCCLLLHIALSFYVSFLLDE